MPAKKMSGCHPDLIHIIDKLAQVCSLDLTDYVVTFGCEDVDSFLKGLYKVQLKGNRDGHTIKINIIIKWHPDPETRARFREAYRREYLFYRRITPKLLEIQRSFNHIEGLKIKFPNCVFASAEFDKETIAVQGLNQNGFRPCDRFIRMDLQHVSLVMKNMAKLHALSFALAKKNPREFEEIREWCRNDVQYPTPGPTPKTMRSFYDASVNMVADVVARDKLKELGPYILTVLNKCSQADTHSTVCHADCWNNNILFKYQGDRPVDVVFFDYQMLRIASPVTDISYFLYMSTDRDFLSEHYSHILDIYYLTLAAVLRQCDLDVEEIYPRHIFQNHLKKYAVLGLIEALVSMVIITAQNDEALEMTEMKYGHSEEKPYTHERPDCSLLFKRVNDVVTDFFERNYSLDAVLGR